MTIEEITIHAGRTFNHPYEQFSNLRADVTVRATMGDNDNPDEVIRTLQAKCEKSVEDHKGVMLSALEKLSKMRMRDRRITDLNRLISDNTEELKCLRIEDEMDKQEQLPF